MPPGPKEINERLDRLACAVRWLSLRLVTSRGESVGEELDAILDGKAYLTEEGELIHLIQDGPVESQIGAPSPGETRARQQEENLEKRPAPLRPPPGKQT